MDRSGTDWVNRTRQLVEGNGGTWNPCICIQGGGAKGAWEAGVLSRLLENSSTANPAVTWGTSAGALNAMWASTLLTQTPPRRLLDHWHCIASLINFAVVWGTAALFGLLIGTIVYFESSSWLALCEFFCLGFSLWALVVVLMLKLLPLRCLLGAGVISCCIAGGALCALGYHSSALGLLLVCALAALVLIIFLIYWWQRPPYRLPGLFSIAWLSRLLPAPEGPARWHVYMCTADVTQNELPPGWDFGTLGVFCIGRTETQPMLLTPIGAGPYDPRTAAMCSAGLPLLCWPYRIGNHRFLDGGMEANLPGGFIFSQGTMGGRCIICIIPHPAGMLDPGDHISYRTICFLDELKRKQGYYRGLLLQGGAVSVPANTLYPVLIVSPPERLESGLLAGFLRTELLSQEFEAGRQAGEALVNALSSFMAADDEALNEYLLENKKLPDLFLYPVPRPRWWALWANPRWLG